MSVTTESLTQNLPPYLSDAFRQAVERSVKLSHEQYAPYQGQRFANPQQELRDIAGMASRNPGGHAPHFAAASRLTNRGARSFPQHHRNYRDPYQGRMINNIATQGNRVFKEKILPELDARYIQLGQYGSKKHAQLARNAGRDIQQEIMNRQEEALSRGYGQGMQQFGIDHARDLQSSKALSELAMMRKIASQQEIEALGRSGELSQGHEQVLLNQAYENWLERTRHPHEKLEQLFRFLYGMPKTPATLKRNISRSIPQPRGNRWGDFAEGVGMSMLGGLLFGR